MSFSITASGENAERLKKQMKNKKRRKKFRFVDQTSKSDNKQIYCSANELVTDAIFSKNKKIVVSCSLLVDV
jgi:hypothetical protein